MVGGIGAVRSELARSPLGGLNGSVLVLLMVAAISTTFFGSDLVSTLAASVIAVGLATAGTTLIKKRSVLVDEERLAWTLVGSGLLTLSLGGAVVGVGVIVSDSTAAFGPPDILFLLGYGVGMVGLALLPHATGPLLQRLRLLLDGIIGAVALTALFWVFFYQQIIDVVAGSPTWDRLAGFAYPLLDLIMLVTVMIVIVRRSSYRYDPRLVLMVVGVVAAAGADIVFLLRGAGQTFEEADPLFPMHLLAVACFVVAAVIVDHPIGAREYADRPSTPVWAMVLPYGTALVMAAVLVLRLGWSGVDNGDIVLQLATLLVAILVFARQGVAIRENRQFVEKQRAVLVSSISHELRTPLTAMVGFLELLDDGEITDRQERDDMLSIINEQAAHLSGIVADLTMLASEQITAIDLNVAPTPVDQLAWGAVNSAPVDPTSVRIDSDRNAIAFVDRIRIIQAIGNLLTNAVRYGGDQMLLVASADGGDLVLEVHDDGPGVAPKYELIIWEKFERGNSRLDATVPGSGIGLPVTNAIAKAHGGSAGYRRSNRLGGACFWIRLPGRVQIDREPPIDLSTKQQSRGARTA
jgi:signal transduction histidine kinase